MRGGLISFGFLDIFVNSQLQEESDLYSGARAVLVNKEVLEFR